MGDSLGPKGSSIGSSLHVSSSKYPKSYSMKLTSGEHVDIAGKSNCGAVEQVDGERMAVHREREPERMRHSAPIQHARSSRQGDATRASGSGRRLRWAAAAAEHARDNRVTHLADN